MKRYGEKERAKILRAYARHKGSQAGYCRDVGVNVGTLRGWLASGAQRSSASGFVEVRSDRSEIALMTLRVAGAELDFATPPEPRYLAQIIRELV